MNLSELNEEEVRIFAGAAGPGKTWAWLGSYARLAKMLERLTRNAARNERKRRNRRAGR